MNCIPTNKLFLLTNPPSKASHMMVNLWRLWQQEAVMISQRPCWHKCTRSYSPPRVCVRAWVRECVWTKAKKQRTKVQHCSNNSGQLLCMSRHVAHGFQEISVYFTNLIICHLLWILVSKLLLVFAAACFKSSVIIYSGWASFHPPDFFQYLLKHKAMFHRVTPPIKCSNFSW